MVDNFRIFFVGSPKAPLTRVNVIIVNQNIIVREMNDTFHRRHCHTWTSTHDERDTSGGREIAPR